MANTNYMQQPMQNPEDSSDPTNAMNTALALLAKPFKVNTMPTNNNQTSLLIPYNSQIAQSGMNTSQDIKMQMLDDNVGNRLRHNAVQYDGNEVGQNAVQNSGIQIVENMKKLSFVSEIANQYGNRDVVTASAEGNSNGINDAHKEIERVKVNCTSKDTLQQASTSGTQFDNAPVLIMCGSTKYTDLQTELDPYNDMQQKIKRLQAQLGDLKGKSSDTQCASNTLDPLSQKPKDENVSLESQVSKPKGTTKGTRTNTMFIKQSILGKPPSSYSSGSKLYSVTPFPKSSVLPKVDKTNALSKPVTSNSAPSTRESKVVQTVNVIAPRIFRPNPSKTSRVDLVNNTAKTIRPHRRSNSNPSKSKSSCLSNNVEENRRNTIGIPIF
ncbi:hypothetical protein Tco_1526054 [Tanacetum coccineum]